MCPEERPLRPRAAPAPALPRAPLPLRPLVVLYFRLHLPLGIELDKPHNSIREHEAGI
jgi:hypothetical protein